jgi:hypothetical protein
MIGVVESRKHLDTEARLRHPEAEKLTEVALQLLTQSVTPLAEACADGLRFLVDWYTTVSENV